jgi:hypothetical protein
MRRHHGDVFAGVQALVLRIDDESRDAARAGLRIRLGERDVKIRNTAIADPGLAAVDGPAMPPVFTAEVTIAPASEPASGSLRANAAIFAPLATCGR